MMGLASTFATIAAMFGPFVDATARWPGTPVRDAGGSITTPGTPISSSIKAQFDTPTSAMRDAEGFLETDSRILVLNFDRALNCEAKIIVAAGEHAGTWALLSCVRDPAGIGWECRGRKVA